MFLFLEDALNLGIFTHAHLPSQNSPQSSYHQTPTQRESTDLPRQRFFENLFPPTAERGEGNYSLLYQKSVIKYEHDLEH